MLIFNKYHPLCFVGALLMLAYVTTAQDDEGLAWWKTSIIYQIYPRSFKDSNGDGVGDIKAQLRKIANSARRLETVENGITSKLDYFKYLGVDSVWLSPVYTSPMRDFGYDISDFEDIDPIFGSMDDFNEFITEAHSKNINVIMDYVPGHTSTDHVWFQKSVNKEGKYTDYFIWDDGILLPNGTRTPPNNWLSVFGGSAWAWNPVRQQYYYHAFIPEQADLNYRSSNVQWEMKNILRYWLDKGVDGFRVDAITNLYETANVSLNEPVSGLNVSAFQHAYLSHIYTEKQPEIVATLADWFSVLDEYRQKDGKDRYMVIELYADPATRNVLYGTGGNPFNFELVEMSSHPDGYEIRNHVMNEYSNLPPGKWPNFVLSNHDRRRVSYKYGARYADLYNMLLLTLWGTPTTYYGEELGMLEGVIAWEETVDPWGRNFGPEGYQEFSRDPERTPMQWDDGFQAGFTSGNTTWLPLGQNYTTINVKLAVVTEDIFSFIREGHGQKYLIVLNVGQQGTTTDLTVEAEDTTATVVALTPDSLVFTVNQTIALSSVNLSPGDGLVLHIGSAEPIVG